MGSVRWFSAPCSKSETDQHHFVTGGNHSWFFLFSSIPHLCLTEIIIINVISWSSNDHHRHCHNVKTMLIINIANIDNIIIIIITRPKPSYGWQGLAGSWGKYTVRRVHYKVFSTSHLAPTLLSLDWILLFKCGYKNSLVITKNQPRTVKKNIKT